MSKIEWIDVREDRTANCTHMRAEVVDAEGKKHTAEVWTLPRDGSGRDFAAEVDGTLLSKKGYLTDKGAFKAAGKRLLAACRPTEASA